MNKARIEAILGRPEHKGLLKDIKKLKGKTVLITGGSGSIGIELVGVLKEARCKVVNTDIVDTKHHLDVTKQQSIAKYKKYKPNYIVHLAGAKHAPVGEVDSFDTLNINTLGTINLIKAFPNAKIVLTSTCKSCNPETVYGASKLIAERITLNSGNSVARFYNVIQSSGNVFEIWDKQKVKQVAAQCNRYFISLDEAIGLIVNTMLLPVGRYSIHPGNIRSMKHVYEALYKGEQCKNVFPRRGDRISEKLISTSEYDKRITNAISKIVSTHD